jgi:hypothetical protein
MLAAAASGLFAVSDRVFSSMLGLILDSLIGLM